MPGHSAATAGHETCLTIRLESASLNSRASGNYYTALRIKMRK